MKALSTLFFIIEWIGENVRYDKIKV